MAINIGNNRHFSSFPSKNVDVFRRRWSFIYGRRKTLFFSVDGKRRIVRVDFSRTLKSEPRSNFVLIICSMTLNPENAGEIRERLKVQLVSTVGPFGTNRGCPLAQTKREFVKDWNESLEDYARSLGYKPTHDGVLKMMADLSDVVRLDSTNGETRVHAINNQKLSHCFWLIDNTRQLKSVTHSQIIKNGDEDPNGGWLECKNCYAIGHLSQECPQKQHHLLQIPDARVFQNSSKENDMNQSLNSNFEKNCHEEEEDDEDYKVLKNMKICKAKITLTDPEKYSDNRFSSLTLWPPIYLRLNVADDWTGKVERSASKRDLYRILGHKSKDETTQPNHHCSSFLHCSQFVCALMCRRKKKDNPRGRPNKDFAGVTRAPPAANLDPSSDAESQADSVESVVIDCKREAEIDTENEKLKNRAIVEANNDFATTLMKEFFGCESVCISPISISFVLAMSLAGTKGETEAEIVKVLGKGCSLDKIEAYFVEVKTVFKQLSEIGILHNANRIYYDLSIELFDDYKEKVTQLYGNDCFDSLDLSDTHGTAKKINTFVEEITKGNLRDVITADEVRASPMILLNALDFRGQWKSPFDPTLNAIHEFHLLNGNTKKTEIMTFSYVTTSGYFYYENGEMQRICLPYKNESLNKNGEYDYKNISSRKMDVGEISMYIFLPRSHDGLQKLVEDLDGKKLLEWLRLKPLKDYRQKEPTVVDIMYKLSIKIPKFTIRTDLQLSDTLKKIGLEHYFSGNADFSRASNADLQPSSFIHKTFIKADELGTEASAITMGGLVLAGIPSIPIKVIEKEFHADRPFLYAIVSRKQHVLFIGTVMDVDEGNEEELNARKKRINDVWW
ncbi:serpin (serine protease inhibitor) domain-containing protein [Ditylenchus destructor]|uniref:Serpin (Serine protease inhibitor) domain-containing protein n=1 Tax=Ditylenchus destructor TaxID=166010 RepID=A0AAD4QXK8_9BILA|nr:serpin (serine protease inhibitor) domain-containing protein [Ditylenchus destructor]